MAQHLPEESVAVFKSRGVDKVPNRGYQVRDLLAALPPIDSNVAFHAPDEDGPTDAAIARKFLKAKKAEYDDKK